MTISDGTDYEQFMRSYVEKCDAPTIDCYRQAYQLVGRPWPGEEYIRERFAVEDLAPEKLPEAPSRVGILPGWYITENAVEVVAHRLNTFLERGIGSKTTLCNKRLVRARLLTGPLPEMTICSRCRSRGEKAPGRGDPGTPVQAPPPSPPRNASPGSGGPGEQANTAASRAARRTEFRRNVLRRGTR